MTEFVELLGVLVWPITVGVGLVLFRKPLTDLIDEVGRSATSLDLRFVSFEFQRDVAPNWRVDLGGSPLDVRQLTSSELFDSYTQSLFDQLAAGSSADVLIVDLENGSSWLTTRLYLFTALLQERGVRCVVLLCSRGGRRRQVLGSAEPANLRSALAYGEPWLESTYLSARFEHLGAKALGGVPLESALADQIETTPIHWDPSQQIARSYLRMNQRHTPVPDPPEDPDEWVHVRTSQHEVVPARDIWEHTHWVNPDDLSHELSAAVDTQSIVPVDPTESESDLKRTVLLQEGPFVVLAERDETLRGVVDRRTMLDEAVRTVLRPA